MAPSDVKQAFLATSSSQHNFGKETSNNPHSRPRGVMYRWRFSWQAPATMVGALLLGCTAAIGHHLFYSSLNKTRTPENESQQRNIQYGTAFAFIAKACLIAAVGSAYAQHLWFDLRSKFLQIATIDSSFTATTSIFSLLDTQFLWSCKTGAIIATLAWLLPISAVITPGTLSVRPFMNTTVGELPVPTLNFSTFESFRERDSVKASLSRLTSLVMSGVHIPPVDAFIANSTYTLELVGPSLQCGAPSEDIVRNIDAVFEGTSAKLKADNGTEQQTSIYVAFTPFAPVTYSGRVWPLDDVGQVASNSSDWSDFIDLCILNSRPTCSLISPTMFGIPDESTMGYGKTIDTSNALWLRLNDERLRCSVHKTRFTLEFDARHPVTALKSYTSTVEDVFESDTSEHAGFIVAMQPLLDILTGATYLNPRWCSKASMQMTKCTSDLSYAISQTEIHDTALTALVYEKAGLTYQKVLDIALEDGTIMPPNSLAPSVDPLDVIFARNLSLGAMIEEMSRNLTLSFFSDPRYLSNNESSKATVTTSELVNVYRYNMRNLILAYAIAIGTSTLAVIVGLYMFVMNGLTNGTGSFSTILCSTIQNRALAEKVEDAMPREVSSRSSLSSTVASPEMLRLRVKYGMMLDDAHGSEMERAGYGERSGGKQAGSFGLVGQVL